MERVEVLFGPGSVVYGSDAIGGVMSFTTKDPKLSHKEKPLVIGDAYTRYFSAASGFATNAHVSVANQKFGSLSSVTFSDFGDLRQAERMKTGASDKTRGILFGGAGPDTATLSGKINFITIASGGTDQDFGSTLLARRGGKALASPTRAVCQIGGIGTPSYDATNAIEFVTIQSKGNGQDFGDLFDVFVGPKCNIVFSDVFVFKDKNRRTLSLIHI